MSRPPHPAPFWRAWTSWRRLIPHTRHERLHDATGTGPLGGPDGAQPRARRSYLALYQDGIGRPRFTADFGTNGGAELERPEVPPEPSEMVLVSEWSDRRGNSIDGGEAGARRAGQARLCLVSQTRYAADGQPGSDIAPDGVVNQTKRNRLGESVAQVEALGTPAQRTVRFQRHASGQVQRLFLENPDTGEQVTETLFGSTLATSGVARNDVVVGKVYPTGESEHYTVNCLPASRDDLRFRSAPLRRVACASAPWQWQGEQRTLADPNGSFK